MVVRSLGLKVGPAGAGGGSTDDWERTSSTGGGEGGGVGAKGVGRRGPSVCGGRNTGSADSVSVIPTTPSSVVVTVAPNNWAAKGFSFLSFLAALRDWAAALFFLMSVSWSSVRSILAWPWWFAH